MSAPVIKPTQSIQVFRVGVPVAFGPFASNTPLRWEAAGLPPGLTIDSPLPRSFTAAESTDTITSAGHGFDDGDRVYISAKSGGDGLSENTVYFVRDTATDTFKLAAGLGGAAIDISTDVSSGEIQKVSTGLISGTPTIGGFFVAGLTAINADGPSEEQEFNFAVEDAAIELGGSGLTQSSIGIKVDLLTRDVVVPGNELVLVSDTDLLVELFFTKGDQPVTLTISDLELVVEKWEPETPLVVSTNFRSMGAGAYWQVFMPVEGTALQSALSEDEADEETTFVGRAQFRWAEALSGWSEGPTSIRQATKPFQVRVTRALG